MALLNDLSKDYRVKLAENNISSGKAAQNAGLFPQYICRIFKGHIVTDSFIRLYEGMGYDIEINYVPRKDK